nr:MAG TPA: hypothetical protein [Caudoviricetes sp.]
MNKKSENKTFKLSASKCLYLIQGVSCTIGSQTTLN